eukprot:7015847-Pyramimonas_sp.AAC.1
MRAELSSPLNYVRIYLDALLPPCLDKIIYFDTDLVVQGAPLTNTCVDDRGTCVDDKGTHVDDKGTHVDDKGTHVDDKGSARHPHVGWECTSWHPCLGGRSDAHAWTIGARVWMIGARVWMIGA